MDIGQTLKLRRESMNLTIRALAERLGVGSSTVHHWESGTRETPLSELQRWAASLGVLASVVLQEARESEPIPTLTLAQRSLLDDVMRRLPTMTDAQCDALRVVLGLST